MMNEKEAAGWRALMRICLRAVDDKLKTTSWHVNDMTKVGLQTQLGWVLWYLEAGMMYDKVLNDLGKSGSRLSISKLLFAWCKAVTVHEKNKEARKYNLSSTIINSSIY